MLSREDYIAKTEAVQFACQITRMVEGGEDICCAMGQWTKKWISFNEYSTEPNLTTVSGRLFAMEFDRPFE